MPIETPKDIARFFSIHSIQVRPDAAKTLLECTHKIVYSEQKQRYLDKFVTVFKEWQKASRENKASGSVLDLDAAQTIC